MLQATQLPEDAPRRAIYGRPRPPATMMKGPGRAAPPTDNLESEHVGQAGHTVDPAVEAGEKPVRWRERHAPWLPGSSTRTCAGRVVTRRHHAADPVATSECESIVQPAD